MANTTLTLTCVIRWWVQPVMFAGLVLAVIIDRDPDDFFKWVVNRGITVKVT